MVFCYIRRPARHYVSHVLGSREARACVAADEWFVSWRVCDIQRPLIALNVQGRHWRDIWEVALRFSKNVVGIGLMNRPDCEVNGKCDGTLSLSPSHCAATNNHVWLRCVSRSPLSRHNPGPTTTPAQRPLFRKIINIIFPLCKIKRLLCYFFFFLFSNLLIKFIKN